MNEPMHPPKAIRKLIDAVCAADRRYFATHYGATAYTRQYISGELWPYEGDFDAVIVTRIADDCRTRQPITFARPEHD
jgi:hypothetical protein